MALGIDIGEDPEDPLSPGRVAGKASVCRRVSSERQEEGARPAISTGRKDVRPVSSAPA